MNKIEFKISGVDGSFFCDADEFNSYKTMKQLALAESNPAGLFDAMGRIYCGNDEEYVDRIGGISNLPKLNDAAIEAAKAKNGLDSLQSSSPTATK